MISIYMFFQNYYSNFLEYAIIPFMYFVFGL